MLLKRFHRLQRARLTAAPLALRPQWGWRSKLLAAVITLLLVVALLGFGFWLGWRDASITHRLGVDSRIARIEQLEKAVASAVAAQRLAEQNLAVEQSTRTTLARQLVQAQADLTSRQESLVFLDSLLTANDRSRSLRFVACELQASDKAHEFRYRALLAQGATNSVELTGRLEISVDYIRKQKRTRMTLGTDKPIAVKIRHYERADGALTLPADAIPQALEMRVLSSDGRQVIAQCQKKMGGV